MVKSKHLKLSFILLFFQKYLQKFSLQRKPRNIFKIIPMIIIVLIFKYDFLSYPLKSELFELHLRQSH